MMLATTAAIIYRFFYRIIFYSEAPIRYLSDKIIWGNKATATGLFYNAKTFT